MTNLATVTDTHRNLLDLASSEHVSVWIRGRALDIGVDGASGTVTLVTGGSGTEYAIVVTQKGRVVRFFLDEIQEILISA